MPSRIPAYGIVVLLLMASACAEPPENVLPDAVIAEVGTLASLCTEGGGTPHTDNAVKRADINGDGRDDFVVFAGWIVCENAYRIYGDRGKHIAVLTGDANHVARTAFSDMVYDAAIEGTGRAARLWLDISGAGCGRPPAPDFARESFCSRAIEWNPATRTFDYAAVDTVRMIE